MKQMISKVVFGNGKNRDVTIERNRNSLLSFWSGKPASWSWADRTSHSNGTSKLPFTEQSYFSSPHSHFSSFRRSLPCCPGKHSSYSPMFCVSPTHLPSHTFCTFREQVNVSFLPSFPLTQGINLQVSSPMKMRRLARDERTLTNLDQDVLVWMNRLVCNRKVHRKCGNQRNYLARERSFATRKSCTCIKPNYIGSEKEGTISSFL